MFAYYRHWDRVPGGANSWPWPDFHPHEIACGGKGTHQTVPQHDILIHPWAMDALQRFRTLLGDPVHLNSAYRNPEYNDAVGGAGRSKHTMGIAFDVRDSRLYSREAMVSAARQAGFTGFGHYTEFLHIDLRGTPAEWRS